MKIEQVILENFGFYVRKTFQFATAPLVLIYGPNESGKTTALNGIRQALCGFRPRSPYLVSGRTMAAEVRTQMADGSYLEFTRRKGRQDDVQARLGAQRLRADDVRALLCDLDLDSYEQLFGFSLDELRKGEAALKNLRLTDALAGGGLAGMTALQKLRADLEQSLAELYKVRGSLSRINVKLNEIEQSHEALREVQALPSVVEELLDKLSSEQQRSEQLKQEYAVAYVRFNAAQRILAALPSYREMQRVAHQLSEMDIPAGIDLAFAAQWSEQCARRREIATRLQEETRELDQEKLHLNKLGTTGPLLALEQDIERLGHQAGEISAQRLRLIELTSQYAEAATVCDRLLENLDLPTVTAKLREFALSAPVRKQLETLSTSFVGLNDELMQVTAKLEAANESLVAIEIALEAEPAPDNVAHLAGSIARLKDAEQDFGRKATSLKRLLEDPQTLELSHRLTHAVGDIPQLDPTWPVPTADWLAAHKSAVEDIHRESLQVDRRIVELQQAVVHSQEEISRLNHNSPAEINLQRCAALAHDRDDLIQRWLDELAEPLMAASITTAWQIQRLQQLQALLSEADSLQSQVLAGADSLAASQQLNRQLNKLMEELKLVQQSRQALDAKSCLLDSGWREMWSGCPFQPRTVAEMARWLQDYSDWINLQREVDQARREAHMARNIIRQLRLKLQDAWPSNLREDVTTETLTECVRSWELALRDATRDKSRLASARANVESLKYRAAELAAARQELVDRYSDWLAHAPVTQWPLEQLSALLDSVEHLRREDAALRRLQQQRKDIENQLEYYRASVQTLSQQLQDALGDAQPEIFAKQCLKRLQQSREFQTERVRLSSSIEYRGRQIAELAIRQGQTEARLAELSQAAGGMDVVSMGTLMERVRQVERLRSQQSELTATVEAQAIGQTATEFLLSLSTAEETQLLLEVKELERSLSSLDEARRQSDESVGSLTQQIEYLANNQAAQRNLQQLHSRRWELAELADQWIVERLAQELLTRSIERFATDNEPVLLQLTRSYLAKLTGGRYTTIEHDSRDLGSFIVRNTLQESFEPSRLSTGTREQLYLAIRMAFITHHSQHHEPLPVIMDDCFVNFDDQRTRLALEAIANWDSSMQTILLSCHWRIVEFLAAVAPQTPVIQLENDQMLTAVELIASDRPEEVGHYLR